MVDPEPTASGDDLDFTDASLLRAAAAAPARALPPKAPGPGTRIGDRFLVRRTLGRGGMGIVVLAEDTRLRREVAVKLSGIDPFGATAGRMRREAQAMARLDDANVLEVYDVGEHEGALFIAMEYAPGGSLRQWLDRGPHPWRSVLDVFLAAGRGLAAAHAHGIVHRDFKPDNVLFDANGRPRVADFGLARAADDDSSSGLPLDSLTATGVALGTPAYMPPEQYGGPVDARADQFAFCVALWEGIFGERPFAGESAAQLLLSISEGRIRAMPAGRDVPAAIEAVLRRGLAARPADRFGSMAILVGALQRAARRRAVPGGAILGAVALALLGSAGTLALARSRLPLSPLSLPAIASDDAAAVAALLERAERARALIYDDQLDEAQSELELVIAVLGRLRPPDAEVAARPWELLGDLHARRDDPIRAHRAYVNALIILQRHRAPDDIDVMALRRTVHDVELDTRLP